MCIIAMCWHYWTFFKLILFGLIHIFNDEYVSLKGRKQEKYNKEHFGKLTDSSKLAAANRLFPLLVQLGRLTDTNFLQPENPESLMYVKSGISIVSSA